MWGDLTVQPSEVGDPRRLDALLCHTTYGSRMQCMQAAMWAGVDAHQQYTLNQERTARQWLLRWGDHANVGGSSNGAAGTYLPLPAL